MYRNVLKDMANRLSFRALNSCEFRVPRGSKHYLRPEFTHEWRPFPKIKAISSSTARSIITYFDQIRCTPIKARRGHRFAARYSPYGRVSQPACPALEITDGIKIGSKTK